MKSANQINIIKNELIPAAAGIPAGDEKLEGFFVRFGECHPSEVQDLIANFSEYPSCGAPWLAPPIAS